MSAKTLTVTDAVRNFSDYLNRVAYKNEAFRLQRGNRTVAELRPVVQGICAEDLADIFNTAKPLTADQANAYARDIENIRRDLNGEDRGE